MLKNIYLDGEKITFMKNKTTKLDAEKETFPFTGKIIIAENGYGFVKFNGVTIFVPADLLSGGNITNKSIVRGEFVSSFDKKRNQDGFKAVSIES